MDELYSSKIYASLWAGNHEAQLARVAMEARHKAEWRAIDNKRKESEIWCLVSDGEELVLGAW